MTLSDSTKKPPLTLNRRRAAFRRICDHAIVDPKLTGPTEQIKLM